MQQSKLKGKYQELSDIFYELKPELRERGDLHGCKLIDDLEFDSLDLIELLVMMEEAIGEDVYDMENLLDVIQEYEFSFCSELFPEGDKLLWFRREV